MVTYSIQEKQNTAFVNRLYTNSIYLILNSVVGAGIGYFFWFVAARLTTPEEVGIGSALISAAGLLSFFGSLGLGYGLIRFLPSSKDRVQMINNSLTISTLITVILSSVFVVGLPLWNPALSVITRNPFFIILFILLTAILAMMNINSQTFVSYRHANLSASQTLIFGLSKVGLVLVLLTVFKGFGIFLSWGTGAVVAATVSLCFFLPRIQPGYHPRIEFSIRHRTMYKFSMINSAAEGLWNLPSWLLPLIIAMMLGTKANAFFYISWALAGLLFTIPVSISLSLFAEGVVQESSLCQSLKRGLKLAGGLIPPALTAEILLGRYLLSFFGAAYTEAGISLLRILAVSVIPLTVNTFYIAIVRVKQKLLETILLVSFIACFTITFSIFVLPRTGITGAGIGWLTAQTISCIYTLPKLTRICHKQNRNTVKIPRNYSPGDGNGNKNPS